VKIPSLRSSNSSGRMHPHRVAVVVATCAHGRDAGRALRVEVKTVFDDLLPRNHPYIQVHSGSAKLGGSNCQIMLEGTVATSSGRLYWRRFRRLPRI